MMPVSCSSLFDLTDGTGWTTLEGSFSFTVDGLQASQGENLITSPPVAYPLGGEWASCLIVFRELPGYTHRVLVSRDAGETWTAFSGGRFQRVQLDDIATLGNTPKQLNTFRDLSDDTARPVQLALHVDRESAAPGDVGVLESFSICEGAAPIELAGEPPLDVGATLPVPDVVTQESGIDYFTEQRTQAGIIRLSRIAERKRGRYNLIWRAREESEKETIVEAIRGHAGGRSILLDLPDRERSVPVLFLLPVTINRTNPFSGGDAGEGVYTISVGAVEVFVDVPS